MMPIVIGPWSINKLEIWEGDDEKSRGNIK
jgi:hypothetical protein